MQGSGQRNAKNLFQVYVTVILQFGYDGLPNIGCCGLWRKDFLKKVKKVCRITEGNRNVGARIGSG